jgi:outer membrane protein
MRLFFAVVVSFLFFSVQTRAQQGSTDNVWSLQRCVQFALEHNISIKQDSLTARLARYTLLQSQLSQLPSVSANGSYGRSYGRSINPTTNQFVDAGYNFVSASGNGNLLLFGGLQVRNTILRNRYSLLAELAELDQLKDDVSLNVANSFLTALLAQEQVNVSRNQVDLTKARLVQTRAFTDAGRLPELDVAQLESQLATDSSNLINAIANYNSSILDLKTLLNLDFSVPFTIQVPDVEVSDQVVVSAMMPEDVYQKARMHFGSIQGSIYRVDAAEKGVKSAKGGLYPQLSLGYQIGTNFATNFQNVSRTIDTVVPNGGFILANNTAIPVYQQVQVPVLVNTPLGTQLDNNMRQSVFLSMNVPIFNGWQSQYNVRQAKINLEQSRWSRYSAELTLKQNVYKAHNNAINSIQKYYAAKRAAEAATRAVDFAKKRYDLGLTSTVDLLVIQNQQFAAASNLVSAKYDLIFKLKVIDYYLGKELKL